MIVFETKILDNVDSIVIPTSNAIECYTNLGVNKSKIKVIPNFSKKKLEKVIMRLIQINLI